MSADKMGGQAFPHGNPEQGGDTGMTLWDWYAAAAMQGIMAAQVHGFIDQPANGPFADMAGKMADAMLTERSKRMEDKS